MSTVTIPLASNTAHFSQENELFGQTFNLEFEWVERGGGFWMLHISDAQGVPIALGVKLQPDWPLFNTQKMVLLLVPNKEGSELTRVTLQNEFTLVAHAII